MTLIGRCATWEVSKKSFLDGFFPRKKRETKMLEFINI